MLCTYSPIYAFFRLHCGIRIKYSSRIHVLYDIYEYIIFECAEYLTGDTMLDVLFFSLLLLFLIFHSEHSSHTQTKLYGYLCVCCAAVFTLPLIFIFFSFLLAMPTATTIELHDIYTRIEKQMQKTKNRISEKNERNI